MKRVLNLFTAAWLLVEAFSKFFLVLLLVGLGGMALAQVADPTTASSFNFAVWGKSAAGFGLFVAAFVAILKGRFPKLAGYWVLLVSLVIAEGGAFLLFVTGLLSDPTYAQLTAPRVWLAFGFAAFVVASGGWAALFQVLGGYARIRHLLAPAVVPAGVHLIGATHVVYPNPAPGLEPAHTQDGVLLGYTKPLTPSHLVEVKTT